MVRVALAAVITLTAARASAEVCSVAIPRAPDNVREEIELWVRAEPRCSVELEVRVVPTEGGYYLFARDQQGRVRERIVPDAQSAGVLVASWVADDSQVRTIDAPPPSIERLPPRLELAPPGDAGVVAPPRGVPRSTRWVTLGAMVQIGDPGATGLRGEVDLMQRGKWTFSGILAGSGRSVEVWDPSAVQFPFGYMKVRDLIVEAQLSRTSTFGRWHLRLSGSLGLVYTQGEGEIGEDHVTASGTFATGGVSLLFGRELGNNWGFAMGPVVTVLSQSLDGDRAGMLVPVERHETQVMAFGGLRHRL